jgi:hypothetical protein
MNFRNLCYRFLIEKVYVHVGNTVFVKLLEFQWERIELLSLLICFYSSFCTCNVSDFNNHYLMMSRYVVRFELFDFVNYPATNILMKNTLFDQISACRIVFIYKIFIAVTQFLENSQYRQIMKTVFLV